MGAASWDPWYSRFAPRTITATVKRGLAAGRKPAKVEENTDAL